MCYSLKSSILVEKNVGVAGFEPATSCSQSRRDNRATLHPELSSEILRVQRKQIFLFCTLFCKKINAVRGGFEPPVPLQVRQFSKLLVSATHPSHRNIPKKLDGKCNNWFLIDEKFLYKFYDRIY